jgi:hypothetical protein
MIEIRELVLKAQVNQKNALVKPQNEGRQTLSEAAVKRYLDKLSER